MLKYNYKKKYLFKMYKESLMRPEMYDHSSNSQIKLQKRRRLTLSGKNAIKKIPPVTVHRNKRTITPAVMPYAHATK